MIFAKRLNKRYREEIAELQRIENVFRLASLEVKGNTALVKKGQEFAKQLEDVTKLITNRKASVIAHALAQMGIEKASVNVYTGYIKPITDEPSDNTEAAE